MTASTKDEIIERRFTILEEQGKRNCEDHKSIMDKICKIDAKLDTAIKEKADRIELDDINKKLWGFATLFITAFFGILVYMIQTKLGG